MFRHASALVLALALSSLARAQPLTTAFTFQGQLQSAGAPVTGTYDARFRLYDALTGGTQIGSTLCSNNIAISNGAFTVQLDFGSQFSGQQRFLEVEVRQDTGLDCSNSTGFTTLAPRQPLTAIPNALYSLSAAAAGTAGSATTATNATQLNGQSASFYQNAANLSNGTIPGGRLSGTYPSPLNLSSAGNVFTGSGAGLTNIPWASITGAPATVSLQNVTPGAPQTGNLNLSGAGVFSSVQAVSTSSTGYTASFVGQPQGSSQYVLYVSNTGTGRGINVVTNNEIAMEASSAYGIGVDARSNNETALQGISNGTTGYICGVYGQCASTLGFGVAGLSTATSGTAVGVYGECSCPTANAGYFTGNCQNVFVINTGANGCALNTVSGYGSAISAQGGGADAVVISNTLSGRGVHVTSSGDSALWAQSAAPDAVLINNTGSGRGLHVTTASDTAVWGEATSAFAGIDGRNGSTTGRGVSGSATATSGTNYGVLGSTSSPSGYGIFSSGNFGASGSKAFRIDHPADPAHKYLFHYSTESPEVLNAYSGNVTLNQQGEATVDLPAYFARINRDPRYTLTPVGAAMPLLHIEQEVSDAALTDGADAAPSEPVPVCSFTIAGGAPNTKVSWRVEAVRNDRWIQVHGAPVEAAKEGPEDGRYQHPDLYNQPAEKGSFYHEPAFTPPTPPKPPLPPHITSAQLLHGASTTP